MAAALKPWLNIGFAVYSHCQCRRPNGQIENKNKQKLKVKNKQQLKQNWKDPKSFSTAIKCSLYKTKLKTKNIQQKQTKPENRQQKTEDRQTNWKKTEIRKTNLKENQETQTTQEKYWLGQFFGGALAK